MSSRLTQHEIVAWLRGHAKKLNDAADAVEEFGIGELNVPMETKSQERNVTPDMLRARLKRGHSRVPQLTKEFQVEERVLRKIVSDKRNGIVMRDKGWLWLEEDLKGKKT